MIYLLRYGEIFLKGRNKKYFEDKLINNIKAYLNSISAKQEIKLSIPTLHPLITFSEEEINKHYNKYEK